MPTPLVSVIVTTKNEEQNIINCLKSIKAQTCPRNRLEIIIVDNNSIDKTKDIARKYTNKVYNQGPERSAQRNYGAKKAQGSWLLFLDADMILSSTAISKSIEKAQKEDLIALYIPEIILGTSFWSRVRRLERSFYDATPIDAVRLIKTSVFNKINGFDLSLTGPEDWDLDKRIRREGKVGLSSTYNFNKINQQLNRLNYNDNFIDNLLKITKKPILYHNEAGFNLGKYLAKKAYYSASFDKYLKKWGKDDPDIKKQFGFFYRYFGVFIERKGWRKVICFPGLMAGIFILRILVGVNYLKQKLL
ncbi:MAG: Glycosyl transferase family 2 [Microgenomates bacterium 39_7]|nr:MAG: Glycosyl transferase family 2 [Microgenomates bacterium 39_7]